MIYININVLQRLFQENWEIVVTAILFIAGQIIWRTLRKARKKEDWLNEAQKRQQKRNEYMDPTPTRQETPIHESKNGQWSPTGWTYNKETGKWEQPDYPIENEEYTATPGAGWVWNQNAKMWVKADQLDSEKHNQANEEVRRKWEELKKEQAILEELRKPIELTEEEKEAAKQIKVKRNGPTYEEWKAQQQKQKNPRD